jgi:hypothetical protein
MSDPITRYGPLTIESGSTGEHYTSMRECPDGEWVKFADHAAALADVRETCSTYVTMYEAELERSTARRADAARIDWLESWTEGDVQIIPAGQHGGPSDKWLVTLDSDARPSGTRGYRWSCEASGKTVREAIDNCRRALEASVR